MPYGPLLQPSMAVVENGQRGAIAGGVVVVPERAEQRLDAAPPHAAEDIGQGARFLGLRTAGVGEGPRAADRRRHGEELVGYVDQPEEERLFVLRSEERRVGKGCRYRWSA